MKDKTEEFPMRFVLHKGDERQIIRFLNEIRPSKDFRENNQHLSFIKAIKKDHTPPNNRDECGRGTTLIP
jgi:hypothetical protein